MTSQGNVPDLVGAERDPRLVLIEDEIRDVYLAELDAQVWAARKGAYGYKTLRGVIGGLTIVSAGIAAVTAIVADADAITAISAALAALLSAAQQTLAPDENAQRVREEAGEWEAMAREFRHFLRFDLPFAASYEGVKGQYDDLLTSRDELITRYVGMRPGRLPLEARKLFGWRRRRWHLVRSTSHAAAQERED